jgi:HNH endonuclease
MSSIDRATRFRVLDAAGFTCQYCGRRPPAIELEVDHVHPRARGGSHDPANLVAACKDCNRGKHARPLRGSPFRTVLAQLLRSRRRPVNDVIDRAFVETVRAQLARDSELLILGYCENGRCASRTVELYVKDLDRTLLAQIERHGFRCNICGRVLTVKRVSGLPEREVAR